MPVRGPPPFPFPTKAAEGASMSRLRWQSSQQVQTATRKTWASPTRHSFAPHSLSPSSSSAHSQVSSDPVGAGLEPCPARPHSISVNPHRLPGKCCQGPGVGSPRSPACERQTKACPGHRTPMLIHLLTVCPPTPQGLSLLSFPPGMHQGSMDEPGRQAPEWLVS